MAEHLRDAATAATALGFLGTLWFAWASPHAARIWRPLVWALTAGAGVVTVVAGGTVARTWSGPTVLDAGTVSFYLLALALHAGLFRLIAGYASRNGRATSVPVIVAVGTALHGFLLAEALQVPLLYHAAIAGLAVALTAGPVAGLVRGNGQAATGLATGLVLVVTAVALLAGAPAA